MLAVVKSIINDKIYVESDIGDFRGIWCEKVPVRLKEYILELTCDEIMQRNNVQISDCNIPSISCRCDMVNINGYAESNEGSILYIRLNEDLIMLEFEPIVDLSIYLEKYVSLFIRELKLYDTGLI